MSNIKVIISTKEIFCWILIAVGTLVKLKLLESNVWENELLLKNAIKYAYAVSY